MFYLVIFPLQPLGGETIGDGGTRVWLGPMFGVRIPPEAPGMILSEIESGGAVCDFFSSPVWSLRVQIY